MKVLSWTRFVLLTLLIAGGARAETQVLDTPIAAAESAVCLAIARSDLTSTASDTLGGMAARWKRDGAQAIVVPAGDYSVPFLYAPRSQGGERTRRVRTNGFAIDKFEITVRQFRTFVDWFHAHPRERHRYCHPSEAQIRDLAPHAFERRGLALATGTLADVMSGTGASGHREDLPITGITWFDAWAYACWSGRRLPTENEWAIASIPRLWKQHAPSTSSAADIRIVGSISDDVSAFGIFDLDGNAEEWCWDAFVNVGELERRYGDQVAEPFLQGDGRLFSRVQLGRPTPTTSSRGMHSRSAGHQACQYAETGFRTAVSWPTRQRGGDSMAR